MKLIDAEKLKAEIEKNTPNHLMLMVYRDHILALIDSLQQEQQEVDLEKEIDNVIADYSFVKTIDSGGFKTTVLDYAKIARHFYELGKQAMKQQMLKEAVEADVESWRPVAGYTNYEVSNTGKVLSRKQIKDGILLKQRTTWAGYKFVTLHDDNYVPHTCFVHRLVAEAFIPNPENKITVNHKNENKEDNRVSNLEWATYNEQCAHGSMRGAITNFDMRSASDGEKKKFIRMRKYLRERGYIVDSTNLIAYWTNDTKRAIRMESEPIFFQYKQYSGEPIPKDNARNTPRKQVDRIDDGGNITKYNTISEAARDNHVSVSAIRRVLNGANKTGKCNGYLFRQSKLKAEEE